VNFKNFFYEVLKGDESLDTLKEKVPYSLRELERNLESLSFEDILLEHKKYFLLMDFVEKSNKKIKAILTYGQVRNPYLNLKTQVDILKDAPINYSLYNIKLEDNSNSKPYENNSFFRI
jgi:hypothetical protein